MDHESLSVCNPDPQRLPGPVLLHDLVAASGDATAIDHLSDGEQSTFSYKHLHNASDALAHLIRRSRLDLDQHEDGVIPVLLPQCPLLYISLLAILKAGSAFCPLNIDAPAERVKFILKDVSAKIVLATQPLAEKIPPGCDVRVINVDQVSLSPSSKFASDQGAQIDPKSLAYVMYTSGSTGTPKGVGLSHSAATQALLAHDRHIPGFSRFLQFAAPTFDVSVFEIFFPLFRGATLVSVNREQMLNDLPAAVWRMSVDACELTPTVAGSLLKKRENVPTLKLLLTIGEMLKQPVIQEFGGSDARESLLWAMYGPTEATIHCTLATRLSSTSSPGCIGRPLDTVSCFVIKPAEVPQESENFHILPRGEEGELAVGGHQLAWGYLNRPSQTGSVFIETSYGRVYRTGDRAVMRQDGSLECLGRLTDGQVKLRGQRIELGEVEHAAMRTSGCHDACAAVVDSNLVLFCAVERGVQMENIQDNCTSWLPKFMVPGELILMREFPRLPSGKVDKKKLKTDLSKKRDAQNREGEASGNLTQQDRDLLRTVSAVLRRKVTMQMKMTDTGLDSLSAIKLAAELRARDFAITTHDLFKLDTVGHLRTFLRRKPLVAKADKIKTEAPTLNAERLLAALEAPAERVMPCTPLQSAMLATTAQNPEMYCKEILLELKSPLGLETLLQAIRRTIECNEALRTGFVFWEGRYVAVVFSGIRNDQIMTTTETSEDDFRLLHAEDFLHPFRVQLRPDSCGAVACVVVKAHHAVYDGWSMDMFVSDVSKLVQGRCPEPRPQFMRVVEFYRDIAESTIDASKAYWGETLLGWNKTSFPKLLSRPGLDEIRATQIFLSLPPDAVQEMSRSHGIGASVLFQTALAAAWRGIVGQSDLVLGLVLSGRTIPVEGIDRILGPCIASMPQRINAVNEDSISDVLRRIHTSNRETMEHCHVPLSEITKLAGLPPNEPLYDVLFIYQQPLYDVEEEEAILKPRARTEKVETKLLVEIEPQRDGFVLQITYHTESINADFVELLSDQIQKFCSSILRDQSQTLLALQKNYTGTYSSFPARVPPQDEPDDILALVDAIIGHNPEAEAIRFVTGVKCRTFQVDTMSFRGLDQIANNIAHFLEQNGAKVGDIVAVIMNKSSAIYSSILGIMRAGCAFLPILPTEPMDRVEQVIQKSQTKFCLINDDSLEPGLSASDVSVLNFNSLSLENHPPERYKFCPDPDRLAYVIYTFETEGAPKGVAISQKNLASNITQLIKIRPVSSQQPRLLQTFSQNDGSSVFEIFFAWCNGMSLCAGDHDIIFSDLEFSLRELEVTHLSLTPTVAAMVDPIKAHKVELLLSHGEAMSHSTASKWNSLLYQGYGHPETTNICSIKKTFKGDYLEHMGCVLPNTSAFILQPDQSDVLPRGWVGELCLGGSQVARRYLNDEASTAKKFVQHSCFGQLYRSGDVGRMLPDGSLVVLGRLEDQLTLHGKRVEANDVSSILTNTGRVTAAVTIRTSSKDDRSDHLTTFYCPSDITQSSLQSFAPLVMSQNLQNHLFAVLSPRLPADMVPSHLVPVPCIPITTSGKVNKSQLKEWFEGLTKEYIESSSQATVGKADSNEEEWSALELNIAQALSDALPSTIPFRRWTPLTAFGVDSISVVGVSKAISLRVGFPVSISSILSNPTIAQLGHWLETHDLKARDVVSRNTEAVIESLTRDLTSSLTISGLLIESILPCIPLQEAMLSGGQSSYYNKILLRLHASPDDMRQYWKEVARRHSIMRTCFVTTKDSKHPIAQVILQKWDIPWKALTAPVASLENAVAEHLSSLPEALDSMVPPCSLAFIRHNDNDFLSFICHHALYDGIAMENIWREVECMANGVALPPPAPYLPFLKQALSLPADVEEFWQREFYGLQGSTCLKRPTRTSVKQQTKTIWLDVAYTDLQEGTRSLGVSLLSLCQASWAAVLSVIFDTSDVTFGNVVSGRTLGVEGIERLVAPCFNTIPLRMDLSRSRQGVEVMKSFQQLNRKLLPYQFSPLKLIQKVVDAGRRNLFGTLLLLQQPNRQMDKRLWTLEEFSGDMDVPLVCEVTPWPHSNSVITELHYDRDLVTEDLASAVSTAFSVMIKSLISSPFQAIPDRGSLFPSSCSLFQGLAIEQDLEDDVEGEKVEQENWSDVEAAIRGIFSRLSGVLETQIHRKTTIFHVGLDSINAVQAASELRSQGYPVSSSDVVECANSENLAIRIEQNSKKLSPKPRQIDLSAYRTQVNDDVLKTLGSTSGIEAILPCTNLQNAMLAAFKEDGSVGDYLNFVSYKIQSSATGQVLKDAWNLLQQKHPILRTSFIGTKHPDSAFAMVRRDHSALECPVRLIEMTSDEEFDVAKWRDETRGNLKKASHLSPWKVVIVTKKRTCREETVSMHIAIHHALYDASSLNDMLHGLYRLHAGGSYRFSEIEPALAEVIGRSRTGLTEAQAFWQQYRSNAVVNKFPVLVSFREDERKPIVEAMPLAMTFAKVQSAASSLGVSIQAVLQSAWARLLASYLGEQSVVFGAVLAGRTTDETASSPLPCLTTVPIVVQTTESNAQLISTMMQCNIKLHKHQYAPLPEVQKWLGHPSNSLFDTIVVYQKLASSPHDLSGWKLISEELSVEYSVSLEIEPSASGELVARIICQSDIVPEEQAQLILRQFDAILTHLLMYPQETEHDLYKWQPEIFSATPAETTAMEAPVKLVHEFVEQRARSQPNLTALEFVDSFDEGGASKLRSWTYRELDAAGNRVAHLLREKVHAGDIVAVHFPKCPEAYFSILGILKAGCAFIALDPSAPDARRKFILEDSRASCVLTDEPSNIMLDLQILVLGITDQTLRLHSSEPQLPERHPTPKSTCYCLYTSGTTGTPKGCEITHENTVQALMAFQHLFKGHWQADSRWLQFAALHFDVSVLEQYWSWSVGITVVAAPRELILDDLVGSIRRLAITHIDLTPSLARLTHPDQLPDLCKGIFITGGEQLNRDILDVWGPKGVIYNAYGPTEATIGVTMYPRVPANGRPSNIGKQFPNVGSYVLQMGSEKPVLRGGVGELCVSGKLVGKGYLHRPKLTEERFPLLKTFGDRVYRTGDLVRLLHDGCFDFLGRADDQVKLRGQRLEIGEIDHVIRSETEGIRDAATLVMQSGEKDVLVTFLTGLADKESADLHVLDDDDGLAAKARLSCLDRLPGYMVPTYFIRLTYIPLSSNNKVDSKTLRSLFGDLGPADLVKCTGRTTIQVDGSLDPNAFPAVVRVLAEFSGVPCDDIGQSTSVFDLGVDSISALRLSTYLKESGFPDATAAAILRRPIVADLVRELSRKAAQPKKQIVLNSKDFQQSLMAWKHRYSGLVHRELGIKPDDTEYILPCSPLQEGMMSKALTPSPDGPPPYLNWFDFEMTDDSAMSRFQTAWEKTISSHSALRSRFLQTPDGPIQVSILRQEELWRCLSAARDSDVETIMERETAEWLDSKAFRLSRPLLFVHVRGPARRAVRLHMFHGLYDGYSFDLMDEYAFRQYNSEDPPSPGPTFANALYYGPFQSFEFCKPFWMQHLAKWRPTPLPNLDAPSDIPPERMVSASRLLALDKLEVLRNQENVTLQAIVLSVWTIVLQTYLSQPCTMGVVVSGRSLDLPHIENTIGPLFNTVPFFHETLEGVTWRDLVRSCQSFNINVMSFHHVPLRNIQKWCSRSRQLFDNLFTFQIARQHSSSEKLPWIIRNGSTGSIEYPLAFEATQNSDGGLSLLIAAESKVANSKLLERMLDQFEEIVATVAPTTTWSSPSSAHEASECEPTDEVARKIHANENQLFLPPEESVWTRSAMAIRDELHIIAHVQPEHIGLDTTILDLGIDSIDVMKLSARLSKRGLQLSSSQMMRHQSVFCMAQVAEAQDLRNGQNETINSRRNTMELQVQRIRSCLERQGVVMADIEHVLPPTSLQQSMIAGMIQSNFEWYFNHDILELDEDVDTDRLCRAWLQVIASSPILRTGFLEIESNDLDVAYCQAVFRKPEPNVSREHIAHISKIGELIEKATDAARHGRAERNLVQVVLVSLPDNRKVMMLSMAHALYDAWSLGLLYDDLKRAYQGQLPQRKYSQILVFQPQLFAMRESDGFWTSYLSGVRPTIIQGKRPQRCDSPHQSLESPHGVWRTELLSSSKLSDIREFCKNQMISIQALCTSCWAMATAHLSQSLDVVFGAVLSGRDFEGADELMFPTFNTVAVRSVLHGSVPSFLQYMESNLADVRDHQSTPLRQVQAAANVKGRQLFNSLFILQKSQWSETPAAAPMWKSIDGHSAVEYPLCAEAEPLDHALAWRVACLKSCKFSEQDAGEIAATLDKILHFLVHSTNAEVVSFHDGGVSICGLSHFVTEDRRLDTHEHDTNGQSFEWEESSLRIREVLSEVSGVPLDAIHPWSTLYHLGLDSISAIKVSVLLRKANINLKPRDLVQAESIGELARFVPRLAANEFRSSASMALQTSWTLPRSISEDDIAHRCGVSKDDIESLMPASSMQVHTLSAWQNAEGAVFYPSFCYKASAHSFTRDQLLATWDRVVQRLPILRARLVSTGTIDLPWLQVVLKSQALSSGRASQPLHSLDVSKHCEDENVWQIRLNIHHALYDGFSLSAILQLYNEMLSPSASENSHDGASISATDWEHFCSAPQASATQVSRRREFWTQYLSGAPAAAAAVSPSMSSTSRTSYLRRAAIPDITALQKLASSHGIGLQSFFLAAYAKTLSPPPAHDHILLGIYLANRTTDTLHSTFPTLSLVPLLMDTRLSLIPLAASTQRHLHLMQRQAMTQVALWEIHAWTGLTVDTFINFLAHDDAVTHEALVKDWDAPAADLDWPTVLNESWIRNNTVRHAYPAAVEIEVAVRGDSLDVGVFGPEERVARHEAPNVVDRVVRQLEGENGSG